MDGAGDEVAGWTADGLAAMVLGGACGFCLLLIGQPQLAVAVAAALTLATLALLRRVKPGPRRFQLPAFECSGFTPHEDVLELTEQAEPEALLLDDALAPAEADSRVVQLFAARPLPTPGELQSRIEAHLSAPGRPPRDATVLELEVDAAAALRQALGDLRRSLA